MHLKVPKQENTRRPQNMNAVMCFRPPLFTPTPTSPWMIQRTSPLLHKATYLTGRRGSPAASKKSSAIEPKRQSDGRDGRINNNNDDDDEIPQVVFERMIYRIVFYVGAPMALGVALIFVFQFLKSEEVWDVPRWLPYVTTGVSFGSSALGIAYGTLSASWDPEKEGSILGWEEAQQNWPELWREVEEEEEEGKR